MTPFYADDSVTLWHGDSLEVMRQMDSGSVDCIVTSPPYYGLRDYGVEGQYGLEESPAAYVETMRALFSEARRVLADDGTLWLNIGDSYYSGRGNPGPNSADEKNEARRGWVRPVDRPAQEWGRPKSLLGIPWRLAFALQDDGWILRNDIIWAKPNAMPESVTDRLSTKHEHLFMFAKQPRYWFDLDAVREPLADSSVIRLAQDIEGQTGSSRGNGGTHVMKAVQSGRPQLRRALELAREKGLTDEHLAAVRAVGMNDTGKAAVTQTGAGRNAAETQRLADEAKAALGGYFREFANDGKGRNPGDVWEVPTAPFSEAHFAVMPLALASKAILAGCKPGGTVLDPFSGSGTTGLAAAKHGRKYVGIDLNREYLELSLRTRLAQTALIDDGNGA